MKEITMFYMSSCPHCKKAFDMIDNLKGINPAFKNIEITAIEERENPEIADKFDYYYVPTFYVDGKKLHEGVPTLEAIRAVLDAATK